MPWREKDARLEEKARIKLTKDNPVGCPISQEPTVSSDRTTSKT